MRTKYGHTIPDDAVLLAENNYFCVWKWIGWYYLSGLGETQFVYTDECEWDDLASVIIEATKKIEGQGVMK